MGEDTSARVLGAGAGLSALGVAFSWLCCLPIALGGLSAGVAASGMLLAPWRPALAAISLGLLAAAFWASRRPRGAPGAACPTRRGRPAWLWALALLSVAFLTFEYWGSWLIYWSL